MNRLTTRLLAAFMAVILVTASVTVIVAGRTAAREIRHVMTIGEAGGMEIVDAATLRDRIAASYQATGTWTEAQALLADSAGHMRMMGGDAQLAAPDGTLLGAPGQLSPDQRATALPVIVDGQTVGWLAVRGARPGTGPTVEEIVAGVNRGVWLAAGIAGAIGFAIALSLAQSLSAPLNRLALAAQRIAQGDLQAQATVDGPIEVRSVAAAFNEMASSLGQQEARRRALLADIAHELRTPLTVLQGQLEALQDGVFPTTPEHMSPLHEQTRHLTHLVDDLRTLAYSDTGQLDLAIGPVAFASLATALLGELSVEATRRGVAFTTSESHELPPLRADAIRLRQVLLNLLSNALRHTPAGGRVVLSATLAGNEVILQVADTGEGISLEDLPHVFDRFYRADRSRSRATGGSGLGLAIARRLTEAHGGRISLESERARGTTVTVHWPAWRAGSP